MTTIIDRIKEKTLKFRLEDALFALRDSLGEEGDQLEHISAV